MTNHRVTMSAKYGAPRNDTSPDADGWTVTLRYQRRRMTVPYYMGPALCREPEASEVLESLFLDADAGDQSFGDFCADLGYDTDSRSAHATWQQCQRYGERLRRLLGADFDAVRDQSS